MNRLSGQDLLRIWELGSRQSLLEQALTILTVALPSMSREALMQLSIGKRDALLFTIREQTFGAQLYSLAECPACREQLEFSFTAAALGIAPEIALNQSDPLQQFALNDYEVRFRLLTSVDLAALAGGSDLQAARHTLVQHCILHASKAGEGMSVDALPEAIVTAVADALAECDPQAAIEIALICPACGHQWQTGFDIVSFFWTEIIAQARRLLREVHTLARAYGWREADILSMSAARRQAYLEMVTND